mgnify:CR=1 FL=1
MPRTSAAVCRMSAAVLGARGAWGDRCVARQRALSRASPSEARMGGQAGRRPNDAALMLGVARQAIWAKGHELS